MSFDTYATLKAAIIEWSHRNDISPDQVDEFIDLCEAEMYDNEIEPLLIREGETRSTATVSTSSRFLALPDGFIRMRRLKLNLSGGDCDVRYMAPEQLDLRGTSGVPKFFSVSSQLEFDRSPDSAYTAEMLYDATFTPLSDSNTSNTVLTKHPSIYMWGSRWALDVWAKKNDTADIFRVRFINAIRGANKLAKKGRYGAAPRIRLEGSTP